ncbi:MAG: ankyrin repeat domain-containing protein, partial [Acidobacteriia bacterium]|nr:ankyrin repeat domain-containing protein [Terriglobia bacterium]
DQAGFPSLLATASTGRPDRCEIAELLLSYEADIHQRGVNDYTPLHLAAARNDVGLIQVLLAHGADPNARTRIDDFSTPLQEAERAPFHDAARILQQAMQQLLGYFPKTTVLPAGWSASANVKEICSVSNCINTAPEGWIERWLHNGWGFFNSRSDAMSVAPQAGSFDVYAYRIWPRRYLPGAVEDLVVPPLSVEPIPAGFVSLGFDVVSKSVSSFFECSPLSCNGLAAETPVNSFCLLDGLEDAVAFAARCAHEQPEPGAYYVVEVLREPGSD